MVEFNAVDLLVHDITNSINNGFHQFYELLDEFQFHEIKKYVAFDGSFIKQEEAADFIDNLSDYEQMIVLMIREHKHKGRDLNPMHWMDESTMQVVETGWLQNHIVPI
jgi:endo-beta-N-acetylglucosaminidase D